MRVYLDASSDIGSFLVQDNEIRFVWAVDANRMPAAALRNSVLKVRADQQEHFAALRAPLIMPPLTVNLDEVVNRTVCKADDLPDLKRIRVDIELVEFPPHTMIGAGQKGLKLKDETVFRFDANGGAATKLTISKVATRLGIELESRYRLPSGTENSMNIKRGNKMLTELRRALQTIKEPILQADLAGLERVATIAAKLHETAKVRFRYYFLVDGFEVDLVVNL